MNIAQIFEAFFIALVASYSLSPLVKSAALYTGYVDHPMDNKVHGHPTPLLGGVAILAAFFIAVVTKSGLMSSQYAKPIMVGCVILLVIGLIDDKFGMMPNLKLLGQFLAALAVIKAGVRVEFMESYYLNVIFSYLWIVGITNSFNLLDNMNGLSAGVASIASVFFGMVAFANGQPLVCALSFALAGSTLGFLKHNFPKAGIFMGDVGSLIIGYILAVISILASWKIDFWAASVAIPLLILGYPIFDTTLVTVIRLFEGRSPFQGGKDHSSHRLALLGLKKTRAVLVIYGIGVALGLSALLIQRLDFRHSVAVIGVVAVSLLSLGIMLARVDSGRFGRKKAER